jgi:glycolate oxidase FAD binding subunit
MADRINLRPEGTEELREVVAWAARDGRAIEARGGSTKHDVGRPERGTIIVDLGALNGVVDYEPSELVLTVRPATPLADIEAMLAERGQMLAFEPWDHGALFGTSGGATIGGIVAAGVAGPRRVSAGGARDHLLGFEAVSGRGEVFKGGGKVVKNVTGYDVSKVIAGSWGQLAIMTELTLKVLPKPRSVVTIWIRGLSAEAAVPAMAHAMGSPCGVAATAHVPQTPDRPSVTAFRLEGVAESVAVRVEELGSALAVHGDCAEMSPDGSVRLWEAVATAKTFLDSETLWRAHVAPSRAGALTAALDALGASYLLDWAGAALWIGAPANYEIRSAVNAAGGHAMLVRAPADRRSSIPIREPETPAVAALSARLKQAFDPAGILDPQRFS